MTALAQATMQRLTKVSRSGKNQPAKVLLSGPAVPVQFNPASMKLSRSNNTDQGGVTTGTQPRQNPSQEAATLSFDLEFDTAEQGSTKQRVDVRDWTAVVRQFVEPPPDRPSDPPPAVRFAWGTLVFDGIIKQVTEELDLFAPDGTPLRAKVSVSITEQNFKYETLALGAAAKGTKGATRPGQQAPAVDSPTGAELGSSGSAKPDQVAQAQDGESAQQLMARLGLDPAAWRAAMTDLPQPLGLAAGTPVQLGAEARAGAGFGQGPGAGAGFAATDGATSTVALTAALTGAAASPTAAGFSLSAAGGVGAASVTVASARADVAVASARASFDVPGSGPIPSSSPGASPASGASPVSGVGPASGPGVPTVDTRSLTYGQGIPLRVRAGAQTRTGNAPVTPSRSG